MITHSKYQKIVSVGAWYDLIATLAFVTPWSFLVVYQLLGTLAQTFSLGGSLPAFEPLHILMVNMFGTAVITWAIVRIKNPTKAFGRYSAITRAIFIIWQVYAVANGASSIILVFSILLAGFLIAEALPIKE